jgi:hypothetical protein
VISHTPRLSLRASPTLLLGNLTMSIQFVFVLLLLLQQATSQRMTPKNVVEGLSTNVDILCSLDRQLHPQYWKIEGRVYDLYSVPEIFEVRGHEAVRLANVDRRMDGWTIQCFTIGNEEDNLGIITILNVRGEQYTISWGTPMFMCVCVCVRGWRGWCLSSINDLSTYDDIIGLSRQ